MPRTLCVGDIHLENFGTWRDADARLVWGVNDFDEAATMPYVFDLIRLATSARLAPNVQLTPDAAADAILAGYREGLLAPRPALLDEHAHWLKPLVLGKPKAAEKFWKEVKDYPDADPPQAVRRALSKRLPSGAERERYAKRTKGGGGLGRPRYLMIAQWQGGRLVREAKALVPSAWHWAHPDTNEASRFLDLAHGSYRSPDPSLAIKAGFVLRRIAPDAHKVELEDVAAQGLGAQLLQAMGAELAAVHAGGGKRKAARILKDLQAKPLHWLVHAAEAAERSVQEDFAAMPPL